MIQFFRVFLIFLLLVVLYQDIKERLVSTIILLMILLTSVVYFILKVEFDYLFVLKNIALNILFVSIQGLLIFIWYITKKKSLKTLIGTGDLLFILALCLGFVFNEFIYVYLLSLVLALIIYRLFFRKSSTVPLAGLMSITWMGYLILEWYR